MRFSALCCYILLLPSLFAAPTSNISTSHAPSTHAASSLTPASSISHTLQLNTSTTPTPLILPTSAQTFTTSLPDNTSLPTQTTTPDGHNRADFQDSRKLPISIVFEVFGGLVGLVFVSSFLRCLYSYKTTPARDRVASFVHRHQLQREMEELRRNPRRHRPLSIFEPAPPYSPRPPSYVEQECRSPPPSAMTWHGAASNTSPLSPPAPIARPNG